MGKIWLPLNVRDSLKPEKRKDYFKIHLKKCSICGKEELMNKNQLRCRECLVKEKRESWKRTHCVRCGRKTARNQINGLCWFCRHADAQERFAKKEGSTAVRCEKCRCRIPKKEAEKFAGQCEKCFDISDLEKQLREKLAIGV